MGKIRIPKRRFRKTKDSTTNSCNNASGHFDDRDDDNDDDGRSEVQRMDISSVCLSQKSSKSGRKYSASVCSKHSTTKKPAFTNIFDKLDIDVNELTKDLEYSVKHQLSGKDKEDGGQPDPDYDENFDMRSAVTSKSLKGLGLKKVDKRKLRHEVWLKKMNIIKSHVKESKEKKNREETAIVGDMKPLDDALPTLDWLMNNQKLACKRREPKIRGIKKQKVVQREMNEGIAFYRSILHHPAYKSNPIQMIAEQLKSRIEQNE
ncbi:hypothetical protein HELRODRAFT_181777 [Helobdella robusta]|uniref:Uncharacterized protein n=1 Tax=Helobdella robusta TaxID=6412 RepID=T1FHB3_HELRO|nr:hypothetical protein HELRODRAFT_181777 [Helobdella robusta]ESN92155.1 hypothetical protein HELRODRAFT_181777 [Helobdella robusta]